MEVSLLELILHWLTFLTNGVNVTPSLQKQGRGTVREHLVIRRGRLSQVGGNVT